jgi:hypothetical protein
MFLAWLAHEVLERVRANQARFVLAQLRVLRDIRVSDKTSEFTSFPTSTTWSAAMLSRRELGLRRCVRIMSIIMVNEL